MEERDLNIELIRQETGCTPGEACEAIDKCGSNVLNAIMIVLHDNFDPLLIKC